MNKLLDQYVKDCLRTESKLETLKLNKEVVEKLFIMFQELTEILDGLKKYSFYGKNEKFSEEFAERLANISAIANSLQQRPKSFILSREDTELNSRMFHGILGIMTEAGELAQIWSKHMDGESFDAVHVQEECQGDIGWYTAIITDELGLDWETGLKNNIDKLKVRYPNKFDAELAANRNLEQERKMLENK